MFEKSLERIIQEQFLLSSYGINISESNAMALFEMEAYLDLAIKDKKQQLELLKLGRA